MVIHAKIDNVFLFENPIDISDFKVKAAGRHGAILLVGIHTKYTFRVPFPGTKVGIENKKRKKPE